MNREIKFRAWHKTEQEMYWFDLLWGNRHSGGSGYIGMMPFGEDKKYSRVSGGDTRRDIDPDDCEIMQFTGLKDKHGNDIYEGDIVKGQFPERQYKNFDNGVVIWAKVRCSYAIEIEGKFGKNYHDLTSCDPDGTVNAETATDYYMQVIGNIYQHPELIEKPVTQ